MHHCFICTGQIGSSEVHRAAGRLSLPLSWQPGPRGAEPPPRTLDEAGKAGERRSGAVQATMTRKLLRPGLGRDLGFSWMGEKFSTFFHVPSLALCIQTSSLTCLNPNLTFPCPFCCHHPPWHWGWLLAAFLEGADPAPRRVPATTDRMV